HPTARPSLLQQDFSLEERFCRKLLESLLGHGRQTMIRWLREDRRQMAIHAVEAGLCSGRAACRILRLSRTTYGYEGQAPWPRQQQLMERLQVISEAHRRYGYRRSLRFCEVKAGLWASGK